MLKTFDSVLTSSDLSIEKVLQAGLPVALVFHEGQVPEDLRKAADELAHEYSGKALIVLMPLNDARQTAARFNVHSFPSLATVREGKLFSSQEHIQAGDLKPQIAYLVGEAPKPASRAQEPSRPARQEKTGTGGSPIPVNETDFERVVLRSDKPVLVDFWAVWCGPCRIMDPVLERMAHEKAGSLKVAKVNVDENPGLSMRYGVQGIPTLLVMVNGEEKDRIVGALPEAALRNRVARWVP